MPTAWVWTNASGSAIERSTWVSAAKLTTASTPVERAADRVGVLDAGLDQLDVEVGEVLAPAGVGELVEHDDVVAVVGDALAGEVRADEPGAAADEQLHGVVRSLRYEATCSGQGGRASASARSVPRTLQAGRGAGRGNSALVTGTAAQSTPATRKTSSAKACQLHCPPPARWWMPVRRRSAISTSAGARKPVQVGQPIWSATTRTSSCCSPEGEHRVDEVLAAGAEQPGGPDDRVVGPDVLDGALAEHLGAPVGGARVRLVGLDVGPVGVAGEDVVGGQRRRRTRR